jgi:hypothetical protein
MHRFSVHVLLVFSTGLALLTPPALAHHSIESEFDTSARLELTGTIIKVEWTNPHTWFYLEVPDPESGEIERWAWEAASPNGLMRRGWTEQTLQVGDIVTVSGMPSRNGSNKANALSVVLSDGERLLFVPATEIP